VPVFNLVGKTKFPSELTLTGADSVLDDTSTEDPENRPDTDPPNENSVETVVVRLKKRNKPKNSNGLLTREGRLQEEKITRKVIVIKFRISESPLPLYTSERSENCKEKSFLSSKELFFETLFA